MTDECLGVAQRYFDLSNMSDFKGIAELLVDTTTYSSQNTGIYLGREAILAMQKEFHARFSTLAWHVNSATEMKPGIVLFDFDFAGETHGGERVQTSGHEYVIVHGSHIQHIEIRNKSITSR